MWFLQFGAVLGPVMLNQVLDESDVGRRLVILKVYTVIYHVVA